MPLYEEDLANLEANLENPWKYVERTSPLEKKLTQADYKLKYLKSKRRCVFLSSDNICAIHEFKPILCRAFPIFKVGNYYLVSRICRGVDWRRTATHYTPVNLPEQVKKRLERLLFRSIPIEQATS